MLPNARGITRPATDSIVCAVGAPGPTTSTSLWPAHLLALAGVVALAVAARLPYLWEIPRFTDETQEAVWALAIAQGQRLPLTNVEAYIGPLWSYLLAAVFLIVGPSLYAPRLLAMALGVAVVIPTYFLGRALADAIAPPRADLPDSARQWIRLSVGLLAAAFLALSPTHIAVNSHIAWSNCVTPLFSTAGLWLLLRAVSRDRPEELVIAALFVGLAVHTHPTAVVLAPGLALYVAIARPGWLRTRWVWLAATLAVAVCTPVLVDAVQTRFRVVDRVAHLQALYGAGETLTPAVYGQRLVLLFGLLTNSLGGALSEQGKLLNPLLHPASAAATLATVLGLEIATRRGSRLPLLAIASFALLLPLGNPRYDSVVPKARYVAPLLPLCYALIALFVVDAFRRAATLPKRLARLAWPARLGVATCALSLAAAPGLGLVHYYQEAEALGKTNRPLFRTIDAIERVRRPNEPVILGNKLGYAYTLGGGHAWSILLFAGRVGGWQTQVAAIPPPGRRAPQLRGLLLLRQDEVKRGLHHYRASAVKDVPRGVTGRFYRSLGRRAPSSPTGPRT